MGEIKGQRHDSLIARMEMIMLRQIANVPERDNMDDVAVATSKAEAASPPISTLKTVEHLRALSESGD